MSIAPLDIYRAAVERELRTGQAKEHAYRPALKTLLETLGTSLSIPVIAINDPKHIVCGAPDFNVARETPHGPLTLGYVEAKDVGVALDQVERGEQMGRYRLALDNLILTDYLEFRWYVDGAPRATARLATVGSKGLVPWADGPEQVEALLRSFLERTAPQISSPQDLAERLARMTHMIRDLIVEDFAHNTAADLLRELRQGFAQVLLPDLTVASFADMFAQTLAYGLFAARVNHRGTAPFSRRGAAAEIPRTNPFLRRLFDAITGVDLDDEPFAGFVDDLAALLAHTDIAAVLADFGKSTRQDDPVVHFYETFLAAYDPKLRAARGVYYTPEPVVSYIVRSVDEALQSHFGCPEGLADTSTVTYTHKDLAGHEQVKHSPRVLLLDPATGTATFLYAVVEHIREQFRQRNSAGMWSAYVRDGLLPRLFGFELLMAPYAVAHLKLALQLAAFDLPEEQRRVWAYDFSGSERLGVFLTNSLEEAITQSDLLMGSYISQEANAAAEIKRDRPIMVVLGNPPYSGHSANKGEWITSLVRDYYTVDGRPLGERNPKWLQDDYVKFLRFGQWRIERSGSGILAFITNHGYLDNPTFRGMRQQLLTTFTDIYLLNLHGNSKKRERPPNGGADENVFDIQQGVAIGIFIKERGKAGPARVHHADLWGPRADKYAWLEEHSMEQTTWSTLAPQAPLYLFIPQDVDLREEYERGWKITDAMPVNVLGFQSHRDHFAVAFDDDTLHQRIAHLRGTAHTDDELHSLYEVQDNRDWKLATARTQLRSDSQWESHFIRCLYRPFDRRSSYFSNIVIDRPRTELVQHLLRPNLSLNAMRQTKAATWRHALVADTPTPAVFLEIKDGSNAFPLYLYPLGETWSRAAILERELQALRKSVHAGRVAAKDYSDQEEGTRRRIKALCKEEHYARWPNLALDFIEEVSRRAGLSFVPDGASNLDTTWGPDDIFHYIYAVLYAPAYRGRYLDFLKSDFPRVPLTSDPVLFRLLVGKGKELVALHLLKAPPSGSSLIGYPVAGSDVVDPGYPRYSAPGQPAPGSDTPVEQGRVYINSAKAGAGAAQYFDGVPPDVWEFEVGGYQVCEKWLKDRRGRTLTLADLRHYQEIVAALQGTIRLMDEIDDAIAVWPLA